MQPHNEVFLPSQLSILLHAWPVEIIPFQTAGQLWIIPPVGRCGSVISGALSYKLETSLSFWDVIRIVQDFHQQLQNLSRLVVRGKSSQLKVKKDSFQLMGVLCR